MATVKKVNFILVVYSYFNVPLKGTLKYEKPDFLNYDAFRTYLSTCNRLFSYFKLFLEIKYMK